MFKKKLKTITLAATMLASLTAMASPATAETGIGTEGKDWAYQEFDITTGSTVKVTGTCKTVNAGNGNKTRLIMKVDGHPTHDFTYDKAEANYTTTVRGNGAHSVFIQCHNRIADAYKAEIRLSRSSRPEF